MGRPLADKAQRCGRRRPRPASGGAPVGLGSALDAARRRHGGLFLWCAWTFAAILGVMLALALVTGLDALWGLLRTIDVPPSSDEVELAANALFALAITSPQYVVLRVVLNYRSAAATAWIPTSVVLFVVEDFVAIYWFRDQMPALIGFGFWAILSLGQGLVLADMLGRRSAVPLWLVAMGVVLGAFFLVGLIPGTLSGMNMLVQAVVGGAIVGLIYGGISGGFLLLLVRLAVRKPPQAPELQGESELLVRL